MIKARLSILASVLALGAATLGGCKKGADEALVLLVVKTTQDVPTFEKLDFSVADRTDLGHWVLQKPTGPQPWHLGYYLPGVNGNLTIIGKALNASNCAVGSGMVAVANVHAGQATSVDAAAMSILTISPTTGGCGSGGSGGHGGAGGVRASGGHGGQDAGVPDSGAGATDAGNNGDGPAAKIELGMPCGADVDCALGHCVDGLCCDTACNGACEACDQTDSKGTCVAITGAPRGKRPACTGAGGPCGGTCDGASRSVCTYPAGTLQCRPASCATAMAVLAANCDGKGSCPAPQMVSCGANVCAGAICAGGCSDTQPCAATSYCAGGVCMPKKAAGQACVAVGDCASGFCADGICCDKACTGMCQACNLTGAAGTCSPVKSGVDDSCNGKSSCDATGTCKKANGETCAATTDCTSGNCVDGHCCGSASCATCQACTGGGGTCVGITGAEDPGVCSGTSTCDANGACKLKAGQTCTTATQCVSGYCADGVCCDKACTGQCEACAETASKGTCVAVTAAPRTGHAGCAGAGTTCAGACDGTNRTACAYPTTACRTASCTNGTATLAATCDGKGSCPAAQTQMCAPNTCSGTACAGGCSSTQLCSGSTYCNGGTCVAKKGNGAACGAGGECTSNNCVDGVCCAAASCGTCQTCASANGTCVAITNADDANASCSGTKTCDATGSCKLKNGQKCSLGTDCISNNCVDTVCCNSACSGACQYCGGIASATPAVPAGTCGTLSGAPMHATCAGSGTCKGTCNGSQPNCVIPVGTMCSSQTCTASVQTNAAFCNSSGVCPTATTTQCGSYTCSGSSCLLSCGSNSQCVSGKICSGQQCITCPNNDSGCGASCTPCGGSSPRCVSGQCQECATSADCMARSYYTCSSNKCVCRPQGPNNQLLKNAGFDTSIGSWVAQGSAGFSPGPDADADSCPHSGSAALLANNDKITQCISLAAGAQYSFGYRFKGTLSGTQGGYCEVFYYSDPACLDAADQIGADVVQADTSPDWVSTSKTITTPDNAASGSVFCIGAFGPGYYDQIFFNSANTPTF